MQKLSKKVTTTASVEKLTLTSILDAVVFDNGATGADLRESSSTLKQSKKEVFHAGIRNARLVLEFKRKFDCPLGELKEQLSESFGESQVTWGMACKDRGFSGKTSKDAANHAGKDMAVARAEEEYATTHKMTLSAVAKKFAKQRPDGLLGLRTSYKDWCLGKAAKKDSSKAVAFETQSCEESGMKWVEKMLKRAQDPSNDLTLTELNRVLGLMATAGVLADTEQAVAEALQA